MASKARYKIRNWSEYNQALIRRGNITLWLTDRAIKNWISSESCKKKRGRQRFYSDLAIETVLMIRSVLRFSLRGAQGFLESLLKLLKLDLPCPNYTTLSRRAKSLQVKLGSFSHLKNLHILVDSTGVKIYGEGEWKVRVHGASKRREWRKIHLGVNADTQEIIASVLTDSKVTDEQAFSDLMNELPEELSSVHGDGAYDKKNCYKEIARKNAIPIIPPRKDGVISRDPILEHRNEAIREMRKSEDPEVGRKAWKKKSKYHLRSLVETQMFRLKTIFGSKLSSRTRQNQAVEMAIWCKCLNKMTQLGLPVSQRIN